MNWIGKVWHALAWGAALATIAMASPAAAIESSPSAPERQILVMVRHPPDHFRPNSAYSGSYGDDLARSARERLARGIARQYGLTFVEGWPMPMIGVDCFIMLVPTGRSTADAAAQVSHDAKVSWAEPVQIYRTQGGPPPHNDPLYPAQPANRLWQLADLHQMATGRGIKIAVIDSGIDAKHPDLSGQLILNRNFVAGQSEIAEDHGTGVAGIIAAKTDNRLGIAGVAPGARLLGLRACWQQRASATSTVCDSLSLAKALYFAIENKADVINLSLSGPDQRLLRELLKTAIGRGQTVVTAFDDKLGNGGFPASMPGVIAVSDEFLAGSREPVYTAPGRDVPTTQPGGRWFLVNGSSYAAAHVSGLVALVRQRQHAPASLTFVSDRPESGRINACATLARVADNCDCACATARFAAARPTH
ncbi:MAG TPA: S8 family serine peptidase [Sphingomicrobium sp.]